MGIVPNNWMPNASMKRVILHWTAGAHRANNVDKKAYHILVEGDGNLVRGSRSILDNVSTADGVYAAHTANLNTGSIGVSACCMNGARQTPFNPGSFPMTQIQWETMAQVAAELCDFYDIEVTRTRVLGHGKVPKELGIAQPGKWDPMVLPWNTSLNFTQVGDQFRDLVKAQITGRSTMRESPAMITVMIQGQQFREAQIFNERSVIKIRPLLDIFNWIIVEANDDGTATIQLDSGSNSIAIRCLFIDHSNALIEIPLGSTEAQIIDFIKKFGFVRTSELATALNLPIDWDGDTRTVTIG